MVLCSADLTKTDKWIIAVYTYKKVMQAAYCKTINMDQIVNSCYPTVHVHPWSTLLYWYMYIHGPLYSIDTCTSMVHFTLLIHVHPWSTLLYWYMYIHGPLYSIDTCTSMVHFTILIHVHPWSTLLYWYMYFHGPLYYIDTCTSMVQLYSIDTCTSMVHFTLLIHVLGNIIFKKHIIRLTKSLFTIGLYIKRTLFNHSFGNITAYIKCMYVHLYMDHKNGVSKCPVLTD